MQGKIVTVIGARPQFIKAAVVSRALERLAGLSEVLVHTGQHYDENMSDIFFDELVIPRPKYNLQIGSGFHGAQTGRMVEQIEHVLMEERPDWVLVYGDTNSTLAGALAAAKLHVPVAHVEAGLRSGNRRMPEEINRVLTDHAADVLFAPTESAMANLRHEGIADAACHLVGDVMLDAAQFYGQKAENCSMVLEQVSLRRQDYVLTTIHRAENTDSPQRLDAIVKTLRALSKERPVVFPVHPRTRKVLTDTGLIESFGHNVLLIDPVGYLDMVMLEKNAALVVTDSGGVQKEAFFHQVPCVTLRDETEWVELVTLGWNSLVPPTDATTMVPAIERFLRNHQGVNASPYGHGNAGKHVAAILGDHIRG